MTGRPPTPQPPPEALAGLRAELDRIDLALLHALRARIDCCVSIAELKRRHRIPMMQPHRIDLVQRRAARFGAAHDVDVTFLHRLYDLIIAETCRVESLVIDNDVRHPHDTGVTLTCEPC